MGSSRIAVFLSLSLAWSQAAAGLAAEQTLTTRDGVQLAVSYLPGNQAKKTVPVVLLHGHRGKRADWVVLARHLQTRGHAVIVPDLRGHGASTRTATGTTLSPNNVNFQEMASEDMGAISSWLVERNNNGELNLDKLCVVGAEMGAAVAAVWAAQNWSGPVAGQSGHDVKALVLLSPKFVFRNLKVADAVRSEAVAKELSILILVGKENASALGEATRVRALFDPWRPEAPKPTNRNFFFGRLGTHLQGAEMLADKSLAALDYIDEFIEARLVKQPFPWRERKTP